MREQVGCTFIAGYNAAVRGADPVAIVHDLEPISHELKGFALEGAGMGFALLDLVSPWRSQHFVRYLTWVAGPHLYIWPTSAPVGRWRAHRPVSSGGWESWILCCAG